VLLPAALPLIFGGQWGSALVTAAANVLLLAFAFGVIRYGFRWPSSAGPACACSTSSAPRSPCSRVPCRYCSCSRSCCSSARRLRPDSASTSGLVMFVSQALQILVVSLAIGAFFVVFGALAVGPDVREAWEVEHENAVLRLTLFGEQIR
jgi:hypothetical protein